MDVTMKIDAGVIKAARQRRAWTQQQLAQVCNLSHRTVQRIEKSGVASAESVAALSAALELDKASFVRIARETASTDTQSQSPALGEEETQGITAITIAFAVVLVAQFGVLAVLLLRHGAEVLTEARGALLALSASTAFSLALLVLGAAKGLSPTGWRRLWGREGDAGR
ncbi:helix-turn-helix domain-containing protein [Ferrimonas balearica]|uniref:helix-turn-helix domain-containing protein n=1 Tax=Ferrimonas balearica TaxID=44012 RepID=UPI001C9956D9|nr:helix-turn-helix domain-containing protein [Ferrimonas balearica]MBY5992542.1 helix-turn-helix domain-containing protein [Ferrimonas balearica]